MRQKPRLLFVSPRFLFPADSGGKIRTSQILKGMKGGAFEITLISPEPGAGTGRFREQLDAVADRFVGWPEHERGPWFPVTRLRHIFSHLPIPVITDRNCAGARMVDKELAKEPDVVVFDFPHSAVLAPDAIRVPSVMFTHNIEAEIFRRHAEVTTHPVNKSIWRNQLRKMERYEKATLQRFDSVVAVSERDGRYFREQYALANVAVIRTGVDLEYFSYSLPPETGGVVFTGSMDWFANVDAIEFLMDEVWPEAVRREPGLTLDVVGRSPPAPLVAKARTAAGRVNFTGYVDDVRPYVRQACAYAIPLRVGGGTRIKVFEAMAMGCPVVSTAIGVEGLPLEDGRHYLRADTPAEFTQALVRLLGDRSLRGRLSRDARRYVEENFSNKQAAREFEHICLQAVLNRVATTDRVRSDGAAR